MAQGRKNTSSFELGKKLKEIVFSSQGSPIFLSFTTLAILFVLFRMKNVEMDYKISKSNRDIEKVLLDNKELKAKNASHLSILHQKYTVKAARKKVEKYLKISKKDFEAILTKEQKEKFELIDAKKKKEMDKFKKTYKHGRAKLEYKNNEFKKMAAPSVDKK